MTARTLSFLLFAALIAAVCALKLGPVLLAALFSYMILDLAQRWLNTFMPEAASRWVSATVFTVTAVLLGFLFFQFVRLAVVRLPVIATSVLPAVARLGAEHDVDLPFDSMEELRGAVIAAVRENARSIRLGSGLLTRGFFQVLIGVFAALFLFLPQRVEPAEGTMLDSLSLEIRARAALFMRSYEKVLGAQVLISLVNALTISVFVAVMGIPSLYFLTLASFILGIIPIVGNIVASAMVVGAALSRSVDHGAVALVFVLVAHKGLYLVASRILGGALKTPTWATLLGILLGEVVLGVPGIILAPALLHYAREELAAEPGRTSAL